MAQDDDPHASYKVYEGDELKGTYATRAEARVARKAPCANGGVDRFGVAPVLPVDEQGLKTEALLGQISVSSIGKWQSGRAIN